MFCSFPFIMQPLILLTSLATPAPSSPYHLPHYPHLPHHPSSPPSPSHLISLTSLIISLSRFLTNLQSPSSYPYYPSSPSFHNHHTQKGLARTPPPFPLPLLHGLLYILLPQLDHLWGLQSSRNGCQTTGCDETEGRNRLETRTQMSCTTTSLLLNTHTLPLGSPGLPGSRPAWGPHPPPLTP